MNKIKFLPLILSLLLLLYFVYGVMLPFDDFKKALSGEAVTINNPGLFFSAWIAGILAIYLIFRFFRKEVNG